MLPLFVMVWSGVDTTKKDAMNVLTPTKKMLLLFVMVWSGVDTTKNDAICYGLEWCSQSHTPMNIRKLTFLKVI
jgi:hypothetical protein